MVEIRMTSAAECDRIVWVLFPLEIDKNRYKRLCKTEVHFVVARQLLKRRPFCSLMLVLPFRIVGMEESWQRPLIAIEYQ